MKLNKFQQLGFSLIELITAMAIIGIVSAIGVPAYQDYVQRSKLETAMAGMESIKDKVAECFMTQGVLDVCDAGRHRIPTREDIIKLPHVHSAYVFNGFIGISTEGRTDTGDRLSVQFRLEEQGESVVWKLGGSACWVQNRNRGIDCTKYLN